MTRLYRPHLRLIAAAGLLITLALVYLWLHLATPFDNGHLRPGGPGITAGGLVVTPLTGGPAGFEEGDLVTAVDGQPIEAWVQAPFSGTSSRPLWQLGETVNYTVIRGGEVEEVAVTLGQYPLFEVLKASWGSITFALFFLTIAAYVFLRRPDVPAARILFLSAAGFFCATTWSLGAQVSDFVNGLGLTLYLLTTFIAFTLTWIAGLHFALVFPQPLEPVKRFRWLLPAMYAIPYLFLVLYALAIRPNMANRLEWIQEAGNATGLIAAVFLLATMIVVIWQYRRHRTGSTRQQIRWLVLASLLVGGSALILYFLPPLLGGQGIDSNIIGLIGLLFPMVIAIAILRHNLFDIDTLLNRTLVYGGLTVVIAALYILVVGFLGTVLQAQGNLFVALVATGLVAILFNPLRERLQRWVNRLMYGERDEPFKVLTQLGERLEDALSPEMVYPTIVETVAQTLKLPFVAIAVRQDNEFKTVESYGKPDQNPAAYPLTHQGEIVGRLLVSRRGPGEDFTEADEQLLQNIARQAGAAVHAVQLTVDLQRSRRQLVAGREEERRRLRRDLHDGLGSTLAALHLQAGVLRRMIRQDPDAAEVMIDEMRADVRSAIDDIRRLVYELRPPALDELGLVAAIRAQAVRYQQSVGETGKDAPGFQVKVEAPESLPPLPAAVEVATYRIVQESLANVAHHAEAHHCLVRLALEKAAGGDYFEVEIVDDGVGLPPSLNGGVGLLSMRERALELGGVCEIMPVAEGGTRVHASLPITGDGPTTSNGPIIDNGLEEEASSHDGRTQEKDHPEELEAHQNDGSENKR